MSIRILLADDQQMMRTGLRMILENQADFEVVAEAEDGVEALTLARRVLPSVVVMDIRMPRLDGIEATRQLTNGPSAATRVLILTTFDADEYVYEALRAGASGFLLKTAPPEDLVNGVRVLAAGEALLAPSITRRLIEEFVARSRPRPPAAPEGMLSVREREVLQLVATGLSNHEIAARLFVTPATVKAHVGSVLSKLDLRDRVQAVVFAYESGMIQPGRR
jgi:DNA-binding NarL/FixJ family response regulator